MQFIAKFGDVPVMKSSSAGHIKSFTGLQARHIDFCNGLSEVIYWLNWSVRHCAIKQLSSINGIDLVHRNCLWSRCRRACSLHWHYSSCKFFVRKSVLVILLLLCKSIRMTSSNGNIFPRYSPVTEEFPAQRSVTRSFWCFLWSAPE